MSTPFKMKGWSPFTHKGIFARHPSKKVPPIGHTKADHKKMKTAKKAGKALGKGVTKMEVAGFTETGYERLPE